MKKLIQVFEGYLQMFSKDKSDLEKATIYIGGHNLQKSIIDLGLVEPASMIGSHINTTYPPGCYILKDGQKIRITIEVFQGRDF